jgi:sulfatase maturation enzyme AslB (radical SAM superfamily)
MDLKKVISIKDYRTFAGPDWPSYDTIVAGGITDNAAIQQEVDEFVAMMRQTYNEINISGDVLAEQNQQRQQQVFYDKHYTGSTHCQIPWNTLGVNNNGDVFLCSSPSWIPKFAGNILQSNNIYEILNSVTAQQIRQEILAGRYYYCNNKICSFFGAVDPATYQSQPQVKSEPLAFSSQAPVTAIPKYLIFDFDYTCNFKCPSCRTELINNNKHHVIRPVNDRIVEKIKQLIIDQIDHQPVEIRWCGGEPFISEVYLDLLDYIIDTKKSNIQHIIQTNGSYLRSKSHLVEKLMPTIKELRISFDAATADTYKKIRVNGDWNLLIDNVQWTRDLIARSNAQTKVTADFVVQRDNYKEIPAFVELCQDLGIKHINFQKMWNWGTWPQRVFDHNNVYDPAHALYPELADVFEKTGRKILF